MEQQGIDKPSNDGGCDDLDATRDSDGVDGENEADDDPHDGDELGAHLDVTTAATGLQPNAHDDSSGLGMQQNRSFEAVSALRKQRR